MPYKPPQQSRFDQRNAGFERLFHEFGETVFIEESSGAVHKFDNAVVGNERTEQRQTEFGTEIVITREVAIPIDPGGRHEAGRPELLNLRGFVIAGGIRYAVEGVETSRAGFAVLRTKRVDLAEMSRENYRRQM
jgi:hypothetical protein